MNAVFFQKSPQSVTLAPSFPPRLECFGCGCEVTGRKRRYCTPKCRQAASDRRRDPEKGKAKAKKRYETQRVERACPRCERVQLMFPTERQCGSCRSINRYRNNVITCGVCGETKPSILKDICPKCYQRSRYGSTAVERFCLDCNTPVGKGRNATKRCDNCRKEHQRAKERARWQRERAHRPPRPSKPKFRTRKLVGAARREQPWTYTLCTECDAPFVAKNGAKRCSDACRRVHATEVTMEAYRKDRTKFLEAAHRRRTRLLDQFVENVRIDELFDRHGGICALCGEPTLALGEGAKRDPRMPSIDHIIPVVRGGEHSYANTQLAHLRCNLVKQSRVV